ncbi:hydrogenase maturation protease [Geoalkalibacter halelectricus]|nr:hydrogenase maturation protease [Geoalkalibacter halelectricus]
MWLVMGYGNLLRADDGCGRLLAADLAKRLPPQRAQVLSAHQLTPELCLEIARESVDRALFIDVARHQQRPFVLHRIRPEGDKGRCGHQLSPELLLMLAQRLYGRSPRAWLLTLPAYRTTLGEELSRQAQAALPQALERCLALLEPSRRQSPKRNNP